MEPRALGAALLTLLFWASAFPAIRVGLGGLGPGSLALLRFLLATGLLWLVLKASRSPLPPLRREDRFRFALAGFLGIALYHLALNLGERTVSAGSASFLISASPIFTALLARFFLGERLSPWGWLGLGLAFLGVGLIAWGEGGGVRLEAGAGLVLLSALASALYLILQKPLLRRYPSGAATLYTFALGTLPLGLFLPELLARWPEAPWSARLSALYLGAFPGALAYFLWTYALARTPASRLSGFLYLSPILALVLSYLWLGEVPHPLAFWGGGLCLLGVLLLSARGRVS